MGLGEGFRNIFGGREQQEGIDEVSCFFPEQIVPARPSVFAVLTADPTT